MNIKEIMSELSKVSELQCDANRKHSRLSSYLKYYSRINGELVAEIINIGEDRYEAKIHTTRLTFETFKGLLDWMDTLLDVSDPGL